MSATTLQAITLVNDMNAKIFFLIVIGFYAVYAYWRYEKIKFDELSNKILKICYFIFSRITLFFYPFMIVGFLHLNTTLDELIVFVASFYGIVLTTTFIFLFILGWEKVMELLGIEKLEASK